MVLDLQQRQTTKREVLCARRSQRMFSHTLAATHSTHWSLESGMRNRSPTPRGAQAARRAHNVRQCSDRARHFTPRNSSICDRRCSTTEPARALQPSQTSGSRGIRFRCRQVNHDTSTVLCHFHLVGEHGSKVSAPHQPSDSNPTRKSFGTVGQP